MILMMVYYEYDMLHYDFFDFTRYTSISRPYTFFIAYIFIIGLRQQAYWGLAATPF